MAPCSFHDVNAESLRKDDTPVDSAVFSKTLRYFWLLFAPIDTLSLDDYVFTVSSPPLCTNIRRCSAR